MLPGAQSSPFPRAGRDLLLVTPRKALAGPPETLPQRSQAWGQAPIVEAYLPGERGPTAPMTTRKGGSSLGTILPRPCLLTTAAPQQPWHRLA